MSIPVQPAHILSQSTHLVPGKQQITTYLFRVPLNHAEPEGQTIELFARSIRRHVVPTDVDDDDSGDEAAKKKLRQAYLVYLQGGPGFECPQPQSYPFTAEFLDKGYQMLYLDQRGTGLSTAVSAESLRNVGDTDAQVQYLTKFRADNIVRDCEAIRLALTMGWPESKRKWSLIGLSFGGFCSITYLSFYPKGLKEVFIAGGLPPIFALNSDVVYKRLFRKLEERNTAYYAKYQDSEKVKEILDVFKKHEVKAPSGSRLIPERFLTLGWYLGFHGGIDIVNDLITRLHIDLKRSTCRNELPPRFSRQTLDAVDRALLPFDNNPLYTILHEVLYCQGSASKWSAQRVYESLPQFHYGRNGPPLFTGEMIFPWMMDVSSEHQDLKHVADKLAEIDSWPVLYDVEQLRNNEVPVYAMVYVDDMYVDYELSLKTADTIKGCKTGITNMAYHDGIKSKADIVGRLWELRCDTLD